MKPKEIHVYLGEEILGTLFIDLIRGKEAYSFQFDDEALASKRSLALLDPDIYQVRGRQFREDGSTPFRFLSDSMPDRWGRRLIERAYGRKNLFESEYLLFVSDQSRSGALRYKLDKEGPFLDSRSDIPPYRFLNVLEDAAYEYEEFGAEEKWKVLLSPGSSLGGARPKATIYGADGELYLVKFGHKNDEYDVSAVEYLTHLLSKAASIDSGEAKLLRVGKNRSIFLIKRFDRAGSKRIHYASFMTLLGANDGDSGSYSFLDIAKKLAEISVRPKEDLQELFRRIAFGLIIHNYDNHLRNHGMLLTEHGWRLSPAFDLNLVPYENDFALGIGDGIENTLNGLLSVARYFHYSEEEASIYISQLRSGIKEIFQSAIEKSGIDSRLASKLRDALGL